MDQKLLVIPVVVIVAVAGGMMYYAINSGFVPSFLSGPGETSPGQGPPSPPSGQQPPTTNPTTTQTGTGQGTGSQGAPQQSVLYHDLNGCQGSGPVTFLFPPIDLEHVDAVTPQGELTNGGHIIPGDHAGINYDPAKTVDVHAMADGFIVRVERQPISFYNTKNKRYHVYIEYNCNVFSSYVHMTKWDPAILATSPELAALDALPPVSTTTSEWPKRVPVKAGQHIGHADGIGLLGILTVDTDTMLTGFEDPSFYAQGEPWKVHSIHFTDYFKEPIKSQLLAKNPRTVAPLGGKIDFDVPGTLSGNWFEEGTPFGGNVKQGYCGNQLCSYWDGHLAFVRDYVTPSEVRVNIGFDTGTFPDKPWGLLSNTDPATITPASGMVKLQLVGIKDDTQESGYPGYIKNLITSSTTNIAGTMLVHMLSPRKVQVEVFPGKTVSQVSAFTSAARTYTR